jgi:hypothetical protein
MLIGEPTWTIDEFAILISASVARKGGMVVREDNDFAFGNGKKRNGPRILRFIEIAKVIYSNPRFPGSVLKALAT